MKSVSGFNSIKYTLQIAKAVGIKNLIKSVRSKNACKTCALGMGGQKGGMVNELGHFPEICKKSLQAQLTDIQKPIPHEIFQRNTLAQLKSISPRKLERLGRLNTPLYQSSESQRLRPVSWKYAIKSISSRLKETSSDRSFFYSSGRSSNEAGFLLQLFVRALGTNNINNCSFYCHQASGVGLTKAIGSGTATVILEDLKKADMIWVIGANPSSNHPRFMTELLNCRRRGGEVVIVNPLEEPGLKSFKVPSDMRSMILNDTQIATEYIQPNIGGDIALFKGIAKSIIDSQNIDNRFIKLYTNGFRSFAENIKSTSWNNIEISSGVSRSCIESLANLYSSGKNVVFAWSMGITQHVHGVDNVSSIVNLALLRGMVGKKHAGLLPLRGHSNVQGIGSMGVTPKLKKEIFKKVEKMFKIDYPEKPGMDTLECLRSADRGEVDFAFLMGGNLFSATPDSSFAERSLGNVPFKVYLTTTLNRGHLYGLGKQTFILPVSARDEETQSTTQESMFNYVRLSEGGIQRMNNVRSEIDIISEIADRVLGNKIIDFSGFRKHSHIRDTIGDIFPGFESLKHLDAGNEEFQIEGRSFHKPVFNTQDKKANFFSVQIPTSNDTNGSFKMASIRSEGQFNTIVYEENDNFRDVESRWVVLMNTEDMYNLNLTNGSKVTLQNKTGKMKNVLVKRFNIPKGNVATYYPESNVLISLDHDSQSKTPGFKSVYVQII